MKAFFCSVVPFNNIKLESNVLTNRRRANIDVHGLCRAHQLSYSWHSPRSYCTGTLVYEVLVIHEVSAV